MLEQIRGGLKTTYLALKSSLSNGSFDKLSARSERTTGSQNYIQHCSECR